MMRKITLSALLLASPWVAIASPEQQQCQQQQSKGSAAPSIEDLRKQCKAFRADGQMKEFVVNAACTGSYSTWEKKDSSFSIGTEATMQTETSTKGRRFSTETNTVRNALGSFSDACSIYTKKEVAVPIGMALPITIDDCDSITSEYISNECAIQIADYCEGNARNTTQAQRQAQSQCQQQSQSSDTMCTVTTLGTLNTCDAYR